MKIKRYIHAIQSGTICNLRCSYCYVPDLKDKNRCEPTKFNYPLEQIAKAISKKRIGGIALITFVGGGETFLTEESVQLLRLFLEEGHVVNAVSNLICTSSIDEICKFPKKLRKRLQFSASFHYVELKKRGLLGTYFENLRKLGDAGISYYINFTVGEDTLPYLEEIKEICNKEVGLDPFALYCLDVKKTWKRCKYFTKEFIDKISKMYDCDYLKIEDKYSCSKRRKEFCYMGDWGFVYNLETGCISPCFDSDASLSKNIVENVNKPIKFEAIGECPSRACNMGARFLGLGVIPELKQFATYSKLYESHKSVKNETSKLTDNYLFETNKEYSKLKKKWILWKRKN